MPWASSRNNALAERSLSLFIDQKAPAGNRAGPFLCLYATSATLSKLAEPCSRHATLCRSSPTTFSSRAMAAFISAKARAEGALARDFRFFRGFGVGADTAGAGWSTPSTPGQRVRSARLTRPTVLTIPSAFALAKLTRRTVPSCLRTAAVVVSEPLSKLRATAPA